MVCYCYFSIFEILKIFLPNGSAIFASLKEKNGKIVHRQSTFLLPVHFKQSLLEIKKSTALFKMSKFVEIHLKFMTLRGYD